MEDAARPPRKGSGGRENSNVKGGSSELVRRRCASQETRPTSTRHISRYRSHHLSVHTLSEAQRSHHLSVCKSSGGWGAGQQLVIQPVPPSPHLASPSHAPLLHFTPSSSHLAFTQPAFTPTHRHPTRLHTHPFFTQHRIRTTPPSLNLAFTQPLLHSIPHSHHPAFT